MSSNHAVNLKTLKNYTSSYSVKDASEFLKSNNNLTFKNKFKTFFAMLSDKDFELSSNTKLLLIGALGYVIMPLDFIPDYIPMAGWIDDAAVLSAVWSAAKGDIQKFLFQRGA